MVTGNTANTVLHGHLRLQFNLIYITNFFFASTIFPHMGFQLHFSIKYFGCALFHTTNAIFVSCLQLLPVCLM